MSTHAATEIGAEQRIKIQLAELKFQSSGKFVLKVDSSIHIEFGHVEIGLRGDLHLPPPSDCLSGDVADCFSICDHVSDLQAGVDRRLLEGAGPASLEICASRQGEPRVLQHTYVRQIEVVSPCVKMKDFGCEVIGCAA